MKSLIVLVACVCLPSHALVFVLNDTTGMTQQQLDGFNAAAALWTSELTDDVTVRIDIGMASLDPGVLGQAGSETIAVSYADARAALISDISSTDDTLATVTLPAATYIGFLTNNEITGDLEVDNNNTSNNYWLNVNRATAKAMGELSDDGSSKDATITFNTDFDWDYDRSDGISATFYDFIGIAAHEIGHALGFTSGVSSVDYNSAPNGPDAGDELDGFRIFKPLDLFRYSDRTDSYAVQWDWAYGGTPYFSLDSGATSLATFETGTYNGSGYNPSHWTDSLGFGIMDPTAGAGELLAISTLDLRAFDVIGWDLAAIPEPSTLMLVAGVFSFLVGTRRKPRRI